MRENLLIIDQLVNQGQSWMNWVYKSYDCQEEYIEKFFYCQLVVSSLRSVQETFNEADMEFTKPPVSKNQVIFFLCF